jgi:hypothetical protein
MLGLILDQLKIRATKNDDQKDSRSQQNLISAEVESFAAKPSQFLTGQILRECLSVEAIATATGLRKAAKSIL